MERRYILYFLLAGGGVLNSVQWWPEEQEAHAGKKGMVVINNYKEDDFKLKGVFEISDNEGKMRRNLMLPKNDFPKQTAMISKTVPKDVKEIQPTLEELIRQSAEIELAKLTLIGIVFKKKVGEAFVVNGDKLYTVFKNDKVGGGRFVVDKITTNEIFLSDSFSTVTGKIPVSGNR